MKDKSKSFNIEEAKKDEVVLRFFHWGVPFFMN